MDFVKRAARSQFSWQFTEEGRHGLTTACLTSPSQFKPPLHTSCPPIITREQYALKYNLCHHLEVLVFSSMAGVWISGYSVQRSTSKCYVLPNSWHQKPCIESVFSLITFLLLISAWLNVLRDLPTLMALMPSFATHSVTYYHMVQPSSLYRHKPPCC